MTRLRLRGFEAADLGRVDGFYAAHSRSYLPTPDADTIYHAGEDGRLFLVERSDDGELVAVAGLFPLTAARTADGREVQVYELAGMALNGAVVGGLSPHTLQDVLLWLRTVGLARSEHTNVCVTTSVVAANAASINAMARGGLRRVDPPGWLRSMRRTWCPSNLGEVSDFVLEPAVVCGHAEALRGFLGDPRLSRTGRATSRMEDFELEFSQSWLAEGRDHALQGLAAGAAPQWETEIPTVRLIGDPSHWIEFHGTGRPAP
jgi:hypothetical protein